MSEMTNGLMTIIIPCYNAEKYLKRCFSSLDSLCNRDISLLFVDDGSKDNTLQMLKIWASNHPNTRVVSKKNGGYATAINTGLDYCESEYVMFMGVDDELVSEGMERICLYLNDKKPDIMAFSTIKNYDDALAGEIQKEIDTATVYKNQGYYEMGIKELYQHVGRDAWILFSRDTSRCFKMSTIGKLRYFGKSGVSADGCFASLLACNSHSFAFLNEICYIWHVHRDSVSGSGRSKTTEKLAEEADVWAAFFDKIRLELTAVPDPIINHFFDYRRLIVELHESEKPELAFKHDKIAKSFCEWALRNPSLSIKSRIKLVFPKLFLILLKVRKLLNQISR